MIYRVISSLFLLLPLAFLRLSCLPLLGLLLRLLGLFRLFLFGN